MHLLKSIILSSTLACLSHVRAVFNPSLSQREGCSVGQPGGVWIEVTTPHQAGADEIIGKWYPPIQSTQRLNQVQLGRESPQSISKIVPDAGGNCVVYHSPDCAPGTGIELENPDKLILKYNR
ncbi:hypothetical protein BU23DRAFT_570644 [Bimuria novae-zelandiae CBS 107.79]|uniref:Uncharacterized protein n=1 Tax=Bimuria novae-zelandiae CBS 107.79 TaxID=1447943 RepID=A0A6A5V061_9PLEO|nr:hypothetical protein BU23DRAFT_570644 [Bimuria novae-zelandiae CBS 107.79]